MLQNGYTPLHIAAKRNRAEVAAAVLKHEANPNAESVVRTWFLLNVIIHVFYVLCHCHSWLQSLLFDSELRSRGFPSQTTGRPTLKVERETKKLRFLKLGFLIILVKSIHVSSMLCTLLYYEVSFPWMLTSPLHVAFFRCARMNGGRLVPGHCTWRTVLSVFFIHLTVFVG